MLKHFKNNPQIRQNRNTIAFRTLEKGGIEELLKEEGFEGFEQRGSDAKGATMVEDVLPKSEVAEEVV